MKNSWNLGLYDVGLILHAVEAHLCLRDARAELEEILAACERTDAKKVLEIGTFRGATAAAIAMAFPEATVYTVDLPEPETAVFNAQSRSLTGCAIKETGVTNVVQKWMDSKNLAELAQDGPFDFIFVDGDHSEEGVFGDLVRSASLLASTGLMMAHDYTDESDRERPD